jgi:beta-glucanase (GH16 family)
MNIRTKSIRATLMCAALACPSTLIAGQPELVFADEFNGTELDTSVWTRQVGRGEAFGLPTGWGNNELQYYTGGELNSFVADGKLNIVVKRENIGGANYTSARLRSLNGLDFLYGRVEASIKLPSGPGYWPAFWMLPTGSPYGGWAASGEIDIMESINLADRVYTTIHYGGPWPANQSNGVGFNPGIDLSQGFHRYAIEWEPGAIRWYFNDQLLFTRVESQWFSTNEPAGYGRPPFDVPFHLLLNVAVGGDFPGPPNGSTVFPQTMQVDWVRVTREVQKPFGGTPAAIPGRIQAEDFDTGYADDAYRDSDAVNTGNAYRMEEVDVEAHPEGFNVGWIRRGEWMEYTIDVPYAGEFPVTARVASLLSGGALRLEVDGQPVSEDLIFGPTGGWNNWQQIEGTVTFDRPGVQVVRVADAAEGSAAWNFDWFAIGQGSGGPCGPADISEPIGELTFGDISLFTAAFQFGDPAADLAEPFGSFTFGDISAFIGAFSAGCP